MKSLIIITKYLNAIQLSYMWDAYSTGGHHDNFEMAAHILNFPFIRFKMMRNKLILSAIALLLLSSCEKIELYNEPIKIKKPNGGKIVTQLKFDAIFHEKDGKTRARAYLRDMESSKQ